MTQVGDILVYFGHLKNCLIILYVEYRHGSSTPVSLTYACIAHLHLHRSPAPVSLTYACIAHLCLHRSLMPASLICACIAHHVVSEKYIFKWISINLGLICIFSKNTYVKQLNTIYLLFKFQVILIQNVLIMVVLRKFLI